MAFVAGDATPRRNHGTGRDAGPDGRAASEPAPLPDETLDALVAVLDEVRHGRSRSRSEVADRTGLSRAIVAARLGELLDRGLVVEGEPGPSTGGRPPRQDRKSVV